MAVDVHLCAKPSNATIADATATAQPDPCPRQRTLLPQRAAGSRAAGPALTAEREASRPERGRRTEPHFWHYTGSLAGCYWHGPRLVCFRSVGAGEAAPDRPDEHERQSSATPSQCLRAYPSVWVPAFVLVDHCLCCLSYISAQRLAVGRQLVSTPILCLLLCCLFLPRARPGVSFSCLQTGRSPAVPVYAKP